MDWSHFERLVLEILGQDDLPDLRPLGGIGDDGVDGKVERLYEDGTRTTVVVQVSMQRAQLDKYKKTVARLREARITYDQLIMVFRDAVGTSVKKEMERLAAADSIAIDIRDEEYLVRQLSGVSRAAWVRAFGNTRQQVRELLNEEDVLDAGTDRHRRAMLASLGAYVMSDRSRLVRDTLFDRTVLATVVEKGDYQTLEELLAELKRVLLGVPVDLSQVRAAVVRLERDGLCSFDGRRVQATEAALESIGAVLTAVVAAVERMQQYVIASVKKCCKVTDADVGRIAINLKRALGVVLRKVGPTVEAASDIAAAVNCDNDIGRAMGDRLAGEQARAAITALNTFVSDDAHVELLATLARSYAAVAIRNMDPSGRRFQKQALGRSSLVLDTDAVLKLLIKELPAHRSFMTAISSLKEERVRVIIPDSILDETLGHLRRAMKTYIKYGAVMMRAPEEFVEANVWHAVVSGYYYFVKGGGQLDFASYWESYLDRDRPREFLEFSLSHRVAFDVETLPRDTESMALECVALVEKLVEHERRRLKAEFRSDEDKRARALTDVGCALLAATTKSRTADAQAYLVSADRAFEYLQSQPEWSPRDRVYLKTECLPELAEFVCGVRLKDEDVVKLLFHPVHVAAAQSLEKPLEELMQAGVDLRSAPLDRLEWDIRSQLQDQLLAYDKYPNQSLAANDEKLAAAIRVADAAVSLGYPVDKEYKGIMEKYLSVKHELSAVEDERAKAVEVVRRVVGGASGFTKKGRRRVKGVLRELGPELESLLEEDADDDSAAAKEGRSVE